MLFQLRTTYLTKRSLCLVSRLAHEIFTLMYGVVAIYDLQRIATTLNSLHRYGRWCRRLELDLVSDGSDWPSGAMNLWGMIHACPSLDILNIHVIDTGGNADHPPSLFNIPLSLLVQVTDTYGTRLLRRLEFGGNITIQRAARYLLSRCTVLEVLMTDCGVLYFVFKPYDLDAGEGIDPPFQHTLLPEVEFCGEYASDTWPWLSLIADDFEKGNVPSLRLRRFLRWYDQTDTQQDFPAARTRFDALGLVLDSGPGDLVSAPHILHIPGMLSQRAVSYPQHTMNLSIVKDLAEKWPDIVLNFSSYKEYPLQRSVTLANLADYKDLVEDAEATAALVKASIANLVEERVQTSSPAIRCSARCTMRPRTTVSRRCTWLPPHLVDWQAQQAQLDYTKVHKVRLRPLRLLVSLLTGSGYV
ncbi:hypothetical protein EXIGLDRAFT_770809 [Exidia glandulosa HHB12029]|uniref:Uncharacterized protein n=1 Tax=Exidia glandulosa HHB12029 TaxID=1314781 RepID=A0A165GGI1_EXIGL|nr:hypothetical protein EXIGLDRAFT_770809 [Exidia glandulosa HHB12029]